MMNSAFKDCSQLAGNVKPRMFLSVLLSANRLSVDPACSNTHQNSADATKSTPTTNSRFRSTGVQPPAEKSQKKKMTTVSSRATPERL